MGNKTCLVVYMPVPHRGYDLLFRRRPGVGADIVYLVGSDLLEEIGYSEKEIRAFNPWVAQKLARILLDDSVPVEILSRRNIHELYSMNIIAAADEVTRALAERYWQGMEITWDTAFLRYDTKRVFSQEPAGYDRVSEDPQDREFMALAEAIKDRTSDWWRQVGAIAVKDGKVLYVKYNRHMPSEHTPYAVGDPRDFVPAGTQSELASAVHCEQQIVAAAARDGVPLLGATLYVTVFPCPACAKFIGLSGFRRCCFGAGHASLNGVEEMKKEGVELIFVK